MFFKMLRRAFQIQRLPTTLTALAVLIGSVIFTYLSYIKEIGDAERLSGILAILTFMAFSEVLERIVSLTSIEDNIAEIKSSIRNNLNHELTVASNFKPFSEFVQGGKDILIIGTTKVGYFSERTNQIIDFLRQGCTVRVILLDPNEDNLYTVISKNMTVSPQRLQSDIINTVDVLKDIRLNLNKHENSRLNIRLFGGTLGVGLLIVDSKKQTGRLQAYFYPYKTSPPDRIGIEISSEEDTFWYNYFVEKYEHLWDELSRLPENDPTKESGK